MLRMAKTERSEEFRWSGTLPAACEAWAAESRSNGTFAGKAKCYFVSLISLSFLRISSKYF